MSLKDCISAAVRQGHLTLEEGDALKKRYDAIARQVLSEGEAKAQLIKEMETEAAERKRRALLTETVRKKLLERLTGYRNANGEQDILEAFLQMHEFLGRSGGTFMPDAETLKNVIVKDTHRKLADLLLEFKRGAITGDLRRTVNPHVAARMANVVRELFGESTGDAKAAALAKIWTETAEELRVRFNEAGGTVGKLERWGLPQGHSKDALLDYGREKWVAYMMGDGVLDRDRTVHPLTKRKMTDEELRESLGLIWDRITTDGWSDKEVTGVPMGRGALWTQHADHRFLHFKSADAWMAYAKSFGNPDPFHAMMGHVGIMARDIAHMETFGPNPQVTRTYLKNWISKQAHLVKSTEAVIREQTETLKELAGSLTKPDPEFALLSDRLGDILAEMAAIRRKHTPQLGGKPSKRNRAKLDDLESQLQNTTTRLLPYWDDPALQTVEDQAVAVAMAKLLDEMRDPIQFASRRGKPQDHLAKALSKADAMWETMRGSNAPESTQFANVMAATRNVISSATLGSAWISSLSDPAFGQDMRMRFGMGMGKANFGRIATIVLRDMITKGSREDAIRASLGLDSAIEMMHRKAREAQGFDGRAWTGFVADRVLTVSGLIPWTQSGKHAAGLDLMGFLADMNGRAWRDLPEMTQRGLAAHGFDAITWEQLRKVEMHEPKRGALYLRPQEIEAALGRQMAERYLGMILRETRYAVPESTVASRSWSSAGTRPGTVSGELIRSMMQFKGFGLAVVMLHPNRIARELLSGDRPTAAAHAGALLITSAFIGAIAMALKDIKDGRDPRKWLDEKTYLDWQMWGAAALQAGGLGIYGDFLFSNTGRHGGGLGRTLAGPMVDRVDNLLGLTMGNVAASLRGEKTNMGREAVRAVRQNTPGGNIWWLGLAYQRTLMDQLQRLADPEAHVAFRRQMQVRQKDYRQDYYWRPGDAAPHRAPDLSRIFATR